MMPEFEMVNSEVINLIKRVGDVGTADELLWASNELSNVAQAKGEAT